MTDTLTKQLQEEFVEEFRKECTNGTLRRMEQRLNEIIATTVQRVRDDDTNNLITAFGMMSENMQRQALGQSMAYTEKDFINLTNTNHEQ